MLELGEKHNKRCKDVYYEVDENSCWNVTSHAKDSDGYALFKRIIGGKIFYRIHRASYCYYNDDNLRDDELVRHMCNNPSCINPNHLLKGSHKDNMHDRKLNGKYNGDFMSVSILTTEEVIVINELLNNNVDIATIGKKYNIDYNTVYDIERGKTWSDVTLRDTYKPKSTKEFTFLHKSKNNKSGVRGVFWNKSESKWKAVIYINNKCKVLGYFSSFEEAVEVRKEAENRKIEDTISLNQI